MKSRETSLSSRTTANGPKVSGGASPRMSARKAADSRLSRAATMVWFRWTGIGTPLRPASQAPRRPVGEASASALSGSVPGVGETVPVNRVVLLRRGEGLVEAREFADDGTTPAV